MQEIHSEKFKEIKTRVRERQITFDEAIPEIEELLKIYVDDIDLMFFYAKCKSETGHYEESISIYEKLLNTPYRNDALFEMGSVVRYKIKNVKASVKYFEALKDVKGKKGISAKYELGTIAQNKGDLDTAEKYFTEIIEEHGPKTRVLIALGRTLHSKGEHLKAVELIDQAMKRKPDDIKAMYDCAMAYVFIGEDYKAVPLLEKVLNRYPNNVNARCILGNITKNDSDFYTDLNKIENPDMLYKIGRTKLRKKQYNEARICFKKLIEENYSNKRSAIRELAKLELEAGNRKLAKDYLKKLLEYEKTNSFAILELGKIEFSECNYNEARKLFKNIIDNNYENKEYAMLTLGKMEMSTTNYYEAEKYLKPLATNKEYSNHEYGLFEYGRLKVKMKFYDEAREIFNTIINGKYANKNYAELELGKISVEEKNYDEARKIFNKLVKANENDTYALFQLGKLESDLEHNNEAKYYFLSVLNKDSSNNHAKYELARLFEKEGCTDEAIKYYEELLKTNSSKFHAIGSLGRLYAGKKEYEKAYFYLIKLYSETPNDPVALLDLAIVEKKLQKYDDAKNHFAKLTKSKTYASKAFFELGKINEKQERYVAAEEYYSKAFSANGKYSYKALFKHAKLCIKLNNYKYAKVYLNMYLEKYPDDHYSNFEMSRVENKQRNYKRAKEIILGLLKNKPDDIYLILELGKIEYKEGNYEEARKYFDMILNIDKNEIHALLEISKIEITKGNYEEARRILTNLLRTDQKDKYAINYLLILDAIEENYSQIKQIVEQSIYAPNIHSDLGFFARYKAGLISENVDKSKIGYFPNQLYSYDKNIAISLLTEYQNKESDSISFLKEVDINKLFDEAEKAIIDHEPLTRTYIDRYIITFDHNIASICGELTNQVVVHTLVNTKQIINIYPAVSNYEHICVNKKQKTRKRK